MSDDKDLTMSTLKDDGLIDPEFGHSKMSKNKMVRRRTFYIVLTLLIFILTVLIIAVFGLSFAYLKMTKDQRVTCTTEVCLKSATILVESMNKSVEPCEDFYQFACGRYEKLHKIPKSASSIDWYDEIQDKILVLIRDFLEMDDSDNESSAVSKSRRLYRSCTATNTSNRDWIKQLLQILDKIGLSLEEISNRQEASNLSSILAGLKKQINLDYLFITYIDIDVKNRSTNRISLYKPSHKITEINKEMSSKKLLNTLEIEKKVGNKNDREEKSDRNNYFKSYKNYVDGIMEEIYKLQSNDCKIHVPTLKTENISQLLGFKDDYSKILKKIYDTDIGLPSIMTVDELQHFTNNITQNFTKKNEQIIDWKEFLTVLFMDVKNVTLNFETDLILVYNIKYFEALIELISKSKDQLLINIWWKVIETLLPYTTNNMRFVQDRFYYETKGLENNPSISLYCANSVKSMMGMAVSRLLLNMESVSNDTKMVGEMLKNIHWAFEKIVKELSWMDDMTKQRTLFKAQQMKTFIGFPKFINDPVQLDDYYSEFEVIDNDYFGNVIRYFKRTVDNELITLRKFNNFTISNWGLEPLEVNAVHWYQRNEITIPSGILQFPLFGHDLQMLNYGFFGTTLGHELTHGFDNHGRKFNKDGNESAWWTNQTIVEYEKRSNCFIRHYESYLIPGIEKKVSGKKTLNENIADNGGLDVSLRAYRKFVNDNGDEPKLPGLEQYSNEQIYFLAFANSHCEVTTRESLSNSIIIYHSPNMLRVIGSLTNSDEFSKVWNCKKGSKMNPKNEKCKIW